MEALSFVYYITKGVIILGSEFSLNRINPNQTQVFFNDGRYETLTDDELELFLTEAALSESSKNEVDPFN